MFQHEKTSVYFPHADHISYLDFLNQDLILFEFESPISNIHGTRISVRKVAKLNPNIMVHESGPQKATLSPPK